VTGPTGVAGSAAVRQALADPGVERVTAISRRPLDVRHEKLTVLLHQDFLDYSAIRDALKGQDGVLWCLGISQRLVTKPEYERITLGYTLAGAQAIHAQNPHVTFCHLSGGGADSREKSRILFARVKGRAENALDRLGLQRVYHFRPAYIHPATPRKKANLGDKTLQFAAPFLFRIAPRALIRADDLGRAMVHVAKHGADKAILENRDIQLIAKQANVPSA
jgi:uncharacterized protein YbjT (DUF2867 family)